MKAWEVAQSEEVEAYGPLEYKNGSIGEWGVSEEAIW